MNGNEKILNELFKLTEKVGALKSTVTAHADKMEEHADRYRDGRDRNIKAQENITIAVQEIAGEMTHKMDKREYKPLVLFNTILVNWKGALILTGALGGGGTVAALKWEKIVAILVGAQ